MGLWLYPEVVPVHVESGFPLFPIKSVSEISEEYDAVVMLETPGSIESFIFGEPEEEIAEGSLNPVIVVRPDGLLENPQYRNKSRYR